MKKLITLILAMIMVLSVSSVAMAFDEDVDKDLGLSRGMFTDVIYRIEGSMTYDKTVYANVFEDVKAGDQYAEAIAWAADKGVAIGVSETEFAAEENLTREQMATMMYRYYAYKGFAGKSGTVRNWTDAASVSDYAVDAVAFAEANGMLSRDANGNINPQGIITGEELREIVGNFYFNEIK